MRTTNWLVVLLLLASAAAAGQAAESRSLLDGKVTLLVPAGFAPMSDEQRKLKYPGDNAPALVLTDESTTVNIALDHKAIAFPPEALKDAVEPMRQQFASAKLNDAGLRTINGHEFLVVDVVVTLPDGPNQNHIALTSFEGRILVISYNCMLDRDPQCGEFGKRVIDSIQLRK